MDNIINFEDYKKKDKGGFAPVTVEKQREQIEQQREEIEKLEEAQNQLLETDKWLEKQELMISEQGNRTKYFYEIHNVRRKYNGV